MITPPIHVERPGEGMTPSGNPSKLFQARPDVTRGGKEEVIEQKAIALCRCGQSSNKPFCDGTHKAAEFGEPESEIVVGA